MLSNTSKKKGEKQRRREEEYKKKQLHQEKKSETEYSEMKNSETESLETEKNILNVNDCLKQICLSDTFSDVVFTFNNSPTKLPAHRMILSMRSVVFSAMFYGSMANTVTEILLEDDTPEIINLMLRYIYSDEVSLDGKTVLRCMYVAKKYCLDGFLIKCSSFLKESLSTENACTIYEQTQLYDVKDLQDKCFKLITQNPNEIFASEGFLEVSRDTLQNIVACDDLQVDEETVFAAVLKWAEGQCETKYLARTPDKMRELLGEALYQVRFPLMKMSTFALIVSPSKLLTKDEQIELYQYFATQDDGFTTRGRFLYKKRNNNTYKIYPTTRPFYDNYVK